jgi:Ca2+-binding RTX toxin-like protein
MKRGLALVVAVAGLTLLWAPSAQAFNCGTTLDSFTSGNSTNLGPNWTEQAPDPAIEAQGFTVVAAQTGLATFNGIQSTEACADVATPAGGGTSYAAIVLKYANLTTNAFIKVQDSNPGISFDTLYFYKGNNGSTASPSQSIPVPFASARLHVSFIGTTVTVDIDTNFDNQPETTLTGLNFANTGLGTGIGLGAYGHARLDNFAIPKSEVPEGTKFSCAGKTATQVGSDAGDIINGTAGPDVIVALGAGDIVRGRGGKDLLCGGNGKDKLVGGPGKDRLLGQAGKDTLLGGPKNDVCNGGAGKDVLKNC